MVASSISTIGDLAALRRLSVRIIVIGRLLLLARHPVLVRAALRTLTGLAGRERGSRRVCVGGRRRC